ncbi:MAG: hypothetical protein OEU86_06450, partial [Gammaproteobacteria bacterium]|nr:hypothetical protein [Gammaproteobacteria bacterium]
MFFSQLEQLGAGWALWFAVIGLVAMAGLLYVPKMLQGNKSRLRQLMMGGKTLNSRLRSGFFLTAIVPLLTLVPVLVIIGSVAAQKMQIEQLDKRADVVAATLPRLLDKQILVFSGLAARLSQTAVSDSKDMLPVLAEFHESSPEFVSLWLATASGDVTVATKIAGEQAESWAGPAAGVSMMDSFAEALAAGGLYVSPAERGAGAAKEPMVFVSAPVSINKDGIKKDEPQLYIQGLLNLRSLFGLPSMNDAGSDVSLVVLDDKQRVLLSSPETLFESFADLSGHAMISGDADTAGSGFSQGVSRYIAAGQPLENGWQVYAVASQSGSYVVMLAYFTLAGLWAFLAAFVGFRLSPLYTQQVIEPLQKLDESLDVFDAERTISNIPNAPANAPQEIRQVFDRVRRSMRNSRDSYHSMLKAVNEGIQLREQLQKKSTPTKSVKAVAAESTIIVHEEPADT